MLSPRLPHVHHVAALALAVTTALAGSAHAGGSIPAPSYLGKPTASRAPDCISQLGRTGKARLVCEHRAWMTAQEKTDFAKLTRGVLLDATCIVKVDIDRRLLDEALAASDRVFDAPPQPVTCELQTSNGPMTIGGTFAPHVIFKDGFATDASPGLANITGVNGYLAMPVVAYVNHAPGIKSQMADMINAIRTQLNARQASR